MTTISTYVVVALACFGFATARYLAMTGLYYAVVYKAFRGQLARFKINPEWPKPQMIRSELYWGLVNNVNFALVGMMVYALYERGHTRLFFTFSEYSWLYHAGLVVVLLLLHDTYFYWIHWLMHRTPAGRWLRHDAHHSSRNVSPWSAFSVHPFEGFLEVVFRLFTLALVPMHPVDFLFFEVLTFTLNIIGHSGFEFFPRSYTSALLTKGGSCATFHYLHHRNGATNLSLFFNHWDVLMGTMNPEYKSFFKQVVARRDATEPAALEGGLVGREG